jgi:hypothetical protein
MDIATIRLYDNEYVGLPWEKAEDLSLWSHEITELESSKLIASFCGIVIIGNDDIPPRCGKFCWPEHQIRVTEDCAWPPPHMFASIAFGCGIELKDGWLALNADQCWCLLSNANDRRTRFVEQ